ncbi:MAG: hypothetical protein AAGE94_02145 [Acidobacteriota bacterium]
MRGSLLALWVAATTLVACSADRRPLETVVSRYANAPEYSIVLSDMDRSGTFWTTHRQRFHVIRELSDGRIKDQVTPWIEVDEAAYKGLAPYLGMTVLAKTADGVLNTPFPPAYHRVGDRRCGDWQLDGNGERSWYWNDRCRVYSRWVGRWGGGSYNTRPILVGDWQDYRSRRTDRPYFGRGGKKTFGTEGSYTRQTNPTFFERQKQRVAQRQASFDQKSKSRSGRGRGGRRGGK